MDNALKRAALREAARADLSMFSELAFSEVSPNDEFTPNWHWNAIGYSLQECFTGEIKRLLITVPPRAGKSIIASVALPAYALGHRPAMQIICASYGRDLAAKLSRDTRKLMETPLYRELFGARIGARDKNTETLITTPQGGQRLATSVGGTLTGHGTDLIIVDDPIKADDAMSETARKNAIAWFDGTLSTRLNDKAKGVIILIMQRLHIDDPAGHVIAKEGWTHLNLPAIAEKEELIRTGPGGRGYYRRIGEPLQPKREPREVLDGIKAQMGSYQFSAQYQQQPIPPEGEIIKWSWFRTYVYPNREERDQIIQSWDTANTPSETSDYSVCTTWLKRKNHYYLLDVWRRRVDFPTLRRWVINLQADRPGSIMLIEDKASGTQLIQSLRADPGAPQPIAIKVKDDKVVRASAVSAIIESGRVFAPERADWLDEFRAEVNAFPFGRDDQVDSMSQALAWMEKQERERDTYGTHGPLSIAYDRNGPIDHPFDPDDISNPPTPITGGSYVVEPSRLDDDEPFGLF